MDSTVLNNFDSVFNLSFLWKVTEGVGTQLQWILNEADHLKSFPSGFRPGHNTEMALVAFVDNFSKAWNGGGTIILALLDLSMAFDIPDHGTLLDQLQVWEREAMCYGGIPSSAVIPDRVGGVP